MGGGRKLAVGATAALAGLLAAVSLCRSISPEGRPPEPRLRWKCRACGHVFLARVPGNAETEGELPRAPRRECPKCGGAAYRLVRLRCVACGHEFDHLLVPKEGSGAPEDFACPRCGDRRVLPADPQGKDAPSPK